MFLTFEASRIPAWVPGVNCTPSPSSSDPISRAECAMTKTCFHLMSLCCFDMYRKHEERDGELNLQKKERRQDHQDHISCTALSLARVIV
jgi:hypothetical protein